jgi:uncharacterized protein (DUF1015 family)
VHPIARAWLTTGGTGAQNYDEFADEAEITAIIAANPRSALAVEMPHRAPDSLGPDLRAALPAAAVRLAEAKAAGAYALAEQVVVLYRITGTDGESSYGMFCAVDTDQISTSADQPGLVIRNEDVFEEKVRERVALAEATGHLLSPVLLLQSARGAELQEALEAACQAAGPPAARDLDPAGRVHEIWPVRDSARLCALAGGGELVVADGNHRSLAAQTGGLPRFLAVVTTPESVTIQPYHRLLVEVPSDALRGDRLAARLPGARIEEVDALPDPLRRGTVYLYRPGRVIAVTLPPDPAAPAVENLDHALVEKLLVRRAFELDPGDKRVVYVGGDYPVSWLRAEVDAGRAEAAILIAPVGVHDFVAVNLARQKLPRKSTWFTPKARAGLVLAELA